MSNRNVDALDALFNNLAFPQSMKQAHQVVCIEMSKLNMISKLHVIMQHDRSMDPYLGSIEECSSRWRDLVKQPDSTTERRSIDTQPASSVMMT